MSVRSGQRAVAAVAVLGTALVLSGCGEDTGQETSQEAGAVTGGGYDGPAVEVNFWHGWTGGAAPEIVPALVSRFNEEHNNITVRETPTPWGDMTASMPLAVSGGNGPDLAVTHGDEVAFYAAQGLLVDAGPIVEDLGYAADQFPPGLLDAGAYDGTQYAIPWSVTPLGFYVNQDVLEEAGLDPEAIPTNREEYLAAAEALRDAGAYSEFVDPYMFTGLFQFKSLLWQHGGELFNEDATEATFNSEAGVQALTWMIDLIDEGFSPREVGEGAPFNALIAGEAAFNWNGVWQSSNPALADVRWAAAPVPQIGSEPAVWSSSTHWVFMNNRGQDPNKTAAAAVFVQWMNDNSFDWVEVGELPAQNDVRSDPAILETYPHLETFIDSLEYARYEVAAPGIVAAEAPIITALSEARQGSKTPAQALDDAAAESNQILEQNNAQYGR